MCAARLLRRGTPRSLLVRRGSSLILAVGAVLASSGCANPYRAGWESYAKGERKSAIAQWEPLARGGNADAQYLVGLLYDEGGTDLAIDRAEAARWYRLAAEQGHAAASNNLGLLHYRGDGVARDPEEALRLYRAAAAAGHARATHNLGVMQLLGHAGPREDAATHLREAADAHEPVSAFLLAAAIEQGVAAPVDQDESIRRYRQAAESGLPEAQILLARRLIADRDNDDDDTCAEALRWLRRAADAGSLDAEVDLALVHLRGIGMAADRTEARRRLEAAAARGSARAAYATGVLAQHDPTVDAGAALAWYGLAASRGHSRAAARREALVARSGEERAARLAAERISVDPAED